MVLLLDNAILLSKVTQSVLRLFVLGTLSTKLACTSKVPV